MIMMNSDFALAVHSLVLLIYSPERMETSKSMAESMKVHPVRVRKILSLLRKNGYIESKEGAKGGFILKISADKISLKDIYRLTSKNTLKPKCHSCNCEIGANIEDVLDVIFYKAEERVGEFLEEYTIQDIFNILKKRCKENRS
ncbi:BadM/Rrf2 family transcriptional regulator [Orenia metallireducens]|uniref:Transcriptional regulator, BadM/Rrf2 family n=2 Tax=Orenia metallireducens TaxID=1413210 RepID=A0A285HF78_9FIRM|nr:BadM/Rrf2 family transcriptional regulator [Orenia metallireducens]SNY34402.1 transcriptional regulator, BadM/Rrf2 family [Orenia metallireducens]